VTRLRRGLGIGILGQARKFHGLVVVPETLGRLSRSDIASPDAGANQLLSFLN
jgi:hypothetical protein